MGAVVNPLSPLSVKEVANSHNGNPQACVNGFMEAGSLKIGK
jgi:hypothetical protein